MRSRVLLEGRPGVGKTTVAARLAELLRERGIDVRGFLTHEVRERGRRVGFTVRTLDGTADTLAHVDLGGPVRVGKYGVDVDAFERVALPALEKPPARAVVVIDEIGKMELASEAFRDAVLRVFDAPVDVVATAHVFRHAITDTLKGRADVDRFEVTRATRDVLPEQLADRLTHGSAA